MYRWAKVSLVALALVAAWALAPPAAIAGTIVGTVHDFTATGGGTSDFKGAADYAVCDTCHTAHHSTESILMWNHTLSSNTLTFGTGAATTAGTTLPTNIGGQTGTTKYCLSCHDGSVAVGDTIAGSEWSTDNYITGDMVIAPSGNLLGTHPVGVPYPDIAGATYQGIVSMADPDEYSDSPARVKIYGTVAGEKGIECATCHDIHNNPAHGPLLREGGTYASICQECHLK